MCYVLKDKLHSEYKVVFVYVEENGIAVRKDIVTGISSSEYIEIKDGLTTSDKVIVSSQVILEDGMAVAVAGVQEEP